MNNCFSNNWVIPIFNNCQGI